MRLIQGTFILPLDRFYRVDPLALSSIDQSRITMLGVIRCFGTIPRDLLVTGTVHSKLGGAPRMVIDKNNGQILVVEHEL